MRPDRRPGERRRERRLVEFAGCEEIVCDRGQGLLELDQDGFRGKDGSGLKRPIDDRVDSAVLDPSHRT